MSSEAVSDGGIPFTEGVRAHATQRHAFRIAGGIAVPFIAGEILGWDLPFIASIFAVMLLATRQPALKPGAALGSVAGIALAFLSALVLAHLTLAHPVTFVTGFGLAIFAGLYWQLRSASPICFFFLVAVIVTPLMAVQAEGLATTVAGIMVAAMVVAILTAWVMHALFPETEAWSRSTAAATAARPGSAATDVRIAFAGTLILLPLVLFLLSQESAALVVTITVLSILRTAGFAQSKQAVFGILLGNIMAGGVAMLAYGLIEAAPSVPMLAAIVIAVALFFGERIATGDPSAPLYAGAATATLVLLGLGLSPFNDASTAFASRVTYVVLASGYALALIALFRSFYPLPPQGPAQSGDAPAQTRVSP